MGSIFNAWQDARACSQFFFLNLLIQPSQEARALDPRAADQIINVTNQVVRENSLTTLMVTHDMEQALKQGDRTIMMHKGEVLADLSGDERKGLDPADLVKRFAELKYTVEFSVAARPPS